ncbi:VanZ family protein [Runella zeae]|uniref:VanZ family protein n=1 Tax=Runella zeae TaxID=94255 RepID=UPI002356136E|nr:VanZ family protein [Runella zeae]
MRLFILLIVMIVSVFYLSWIPNPDIGNILPLPKILKEWINLNGRVRTAIPFLILGFLIEWLLQQKVGRQGGRRWALLSLVFILLLAEGGQLFLTNRYFDFWDIFYGILGSLLGMAFKKVFTIK